MKPEEDQSVEGFLRLLRRGSGSRHEKLAALDALSRRRVTLASWEPQGQGYRTLMNANGEEALAVFSSEDELRAAALRFGWLDDEGAIAIQEAHGDEIIRHAWTREYAFLVVDVAASHAIEYKRGELEIAAQQEAEQTGKFRTSRPPPRAKAEPAPIKVPKPPVSIEAAATQYSMMPPITETLSSPKPVARKTRSSSGSLERSSEAPGVTVEVSVAVTTSLSQRPGKQTSPPKRRSSAKPLRKKVTTPQIEEIPVEPAIVGAGGTYGAASVIPKSKRSSKEPRSVALARELSEFETTDPGAPYLEPEQPPAERATQRASAEPGAAAQPAPSSKAAEEYILGNQPIVDSAHDDIEEGEQTVIGVRDDEILDDDIHDDESTVVGVRDDEILDDDVHDDESTVVGVRDDEIREHEQTVIGVRDDEILDDEPTFIAIEDDEIQENVASLSQAQDGAVQPDAPGEEALSADDARSIGSDDTRPVDTSGPARRKAKRLKERSVHDSIELAALESAPDEDLLKDLSRVLRGYPEIDWASICLMSDGGPAIPAIGLRIADNYRQNVDAIVKAVLDASQPHKVELEILLIDGHDLLRKARESSFLFFPWTPKPFGS